MRPSLKGPSLVSLHRGGQQGCTTPVHFLYVIIIPLPSSFCGVM